MNKKLDELKHLEDILKKYDGEKEMYLGPNNSEKLSTLNLTELLSDVTTWSNLSAQGMVCGILGCNANPKNKCPICNCHYCLEHISWHMHSGTGILEKNSSEMMI